LFLSCAQASCPTVVQADCARFADDVATLQPTVNFVARDANDNDLPNTKVYVDGLLVAPMIDGKPVELDPGSHSVTFSNAGRDETVTVVIGSGDKGRIVQGRFGGTTQAASESKRRTRKTTHPKGALAIAIGGGAVALAGSAIMIYGATQVPGPCSLVTHQCAAPPGDPLFEQAANGARTVNLGIVAASIGATALAGGVVWYVAGAKTRVEAPLAWFGDGGGGIAVRGRF
jgi:hypothetical protein